MIIILCLKNKTKITSVNILCLARSLVMYRYNVSTKLSDYSRNVHKLTGLIHKLDAKRCASARLEKTALNNSGENSNVDVTARNHANNLLALDGKLVEHNCGNGYRACALGNHLLLFDKSKNSRADFVLGYSYYVALEAVKGLAVGESYTLFSGVTNLQLEQAVTLNNMRSLAAQKNEAVSYKTLMNGVQASAADYFKNLSGNTGLMLSYNSTDGSVSITQTAAIPEPATTTLSLLALSALAARRRRK